MMCAISRCSIWCSSHLDFRASKAGNALQWIGVFLIWQMLLESMRNLCRWWSKCDSVGMPAPSLTFIMSLMIPSASHSSSLSLNFCSSQKLLLLFSRNIRIAYINHMSLAIATSMLMNHMLVALSTVIHPIYLQYTWVKDRPNVTTNQLLTLLVILIQFVIYMKAEARWLPSWWPGTCWNPMRSALSLRISWGPLTVSLVIPSIQWLVTAMYGTQLGSLQRSIVSEMRPIAP